jgi:UDP-N-acetylglucosamine transferase subunit ALG13
MSTFVSVGNAVQPFRRLLDAVCEVAPLLPQPVFVQYGAAQEFSCLSCTGGAFLEMGEFERRISEAELLIMHAGAGSVINAIRAGKIPVVMPRRSGFGELVDEHQMEFARELEKVGKVSVAHDAASLMHAVELAMQRQKLATNKVINDSPLVAMVSNIFAEESLKAGV